VSQEGARVRTTQRREALAESATDYVLDHGIAGLSLRPLAAAIGTSDRMLVYHFGSKDALVALVIERSNGRSVTALRAIPAARSPREAVVALWDRWQQPVVARCLRVYAQTAALGLLGQEPYLSAARRSNQLWTAAVSDLLVRSGVPAGRAVRASELADATLFGLLLDQPVEAGSGHVAVVVRDLADAVERISAG
jgi:AcrR family transcriptional regulator